MRLGPSGPSALSVAPSPRHRVDQYVGVECSLQQNQGVKARLVISLNSSPSFNEVMTLCVGRVRDFTRLYICNFPNTTNPPLIYQVSRKCIYIQPLLWSDGFPPSSLWIYYVLTCCFEINHQRWKIKNFKIIISQRKTIENLADIFRIRMSWDVWLPVSPDTPHGDSLFLRPAGCWGLHRADSSHCQQTIGNCEACNVIN